MELRPGCDESQKELIRRIEQESETKISLCYQCGKCAAGCPAGFGMCMTPRKVIRLLQLGMVDEALKADGIWLCVTCATCTTRCPQGVDVAALMDALRREALARKLVSNRRIALFNDIFLGSVARFGRVFDGGLMMEYNLKTGQFFKDTELGLPMMQRGKLHMLPPAIKGRAAIRQIYDRVKRMEAAEQ